MTDRELLELAAKSAGIRYTVKDDDYYKTHAFFGLWFVYDGEPSEYESLYWNPLTDDGDALRLAVKLDMDVASDAFNKDTVVMCNRTVGAAFTPIAEPHGNDQYAATRRAIVRAAAEIGKEM